jgi:hypothetical protein
MKHQANSAFYSGWEDPRLRERITVRLDSALLRAVKSPQASMSEVIRRALEAYSNKAHPYCSSYESNADADMEAKRLPEEVSQGT